MEDETKKVRVTVEFIDKKKSGEEKSRIIEIYEFDYNNPRIIRNVVDWTSDFIDKLEDNNNEK